MSQTMPVMADRTVRIRAKSSFTKESLGVRAWRGLLAVGLQDGQEGLLRDLDLAELLHALLALLLLLEELLLTGGVAAVALGQHVLAHRLDGRAGDDLRAHRGLDRHVEHLPRDQVL